MKPEMLRLIQERGEFLIKNWDTQFSDRKNFWNQGPSLFFYDEIMDLHREKNIKLLLEDKYFLVCMYGALASWGLDRMGEGGPKMRDFKDFKGEILKNKERILKISHLNIFDDSEELKKELLSLFENMTISENKNKTKIVANSKAMHFLLPIQVPIVDREYILRYFISNIDFKKYPNLSADYEKDFFFEVMNIYFNLVKEKKIKGDDPLRVIDSGIVNYIRNKLGRTMNDENKKNK
jgi:hypothetical protein